jgi:hypothetical protein
MNLKERVAETLQTLDPADVLIVYDVAQGLAGRKPPQSMGKTVTAYERVRKALRSCTGSLSVDVATLREDRV